MSIRRINLAILLTISSLISTQAQQLSTSQLAGQVNTLTSAVPFLGITPDARGGAMGDGGVASSPDVNSMHWNPAKYAFIDNDFGVSLSYTPWLRNVVGDINLSYLVGYKKIDSKQTVAGSLRYFSLGNIVFTDITGTETGNYHPNEFAIDLGYSLLLSKRLSAAVAARYIHSDLTGGAVADGSATHAGNAIAMDFATYYTRDFTLKGQKARWTLGLNLSNIGTKITYSDDSKSNFLPMNMRVGGGFFYQINEYNSISAQLDLNKMLIPTPPYYDPQQPSTIYAGRNADVAVAQAIFQSFYDAPGGLREELHEINYALGFEYWYAQQFAIRAGYFYEDETKGNRKFFTSGLGLKLNLVTIDASYIIAVDNQHPLKNTLRISLTMGTDTFRSKKNTAKSR